MVHFECASKDMVTRAPPTTVQNLFNQNNEKLLIMDVVIQLRMKKNGSKFLIVIL